MTESTENAPSQFAQPWVAAAVSIIPILLVGKFVSPVVGWLVGLVVATVVIAFYKVANNEN